MALIVPEAQTPFSPVDQPRMNPNMATGWDGLGAVADSLIEVRAQKVKAENDRTMREARLNAIERLDETRLRYEEDTNLEGLTERWETDAGAISAEIAKGLPAHMRADFELGLRETVAPQTSAIRRREMALFKDRETAALNGDMRRIESAAAKAPTREAADAIYADAGDIVQRAQDANLISAVEADRMMADVPANAERIRAMEQVEQDPDAFLEDLKTGEYSFLPPDQAKSMELAARRNSAADQARRAREDKLVADVANKELGDRVDGAVKVIDAGMDFEGLPDLLEQARGTPHYDRLVASIDVQDTSENFALMTPAEQQDYLSKFTATPTGNPSDVGKANRLREIQKNTRSSLVADPLAHVRDRRIMAVEPVDIADPASVQRRVAQAEAVFREFTPEATSIRYFDKPEADQLASVLAGQDVDQALAVATSIAQTFGDRAGQAFAQIGAADPVVQLAGTLVSDTGDAAAARTMLQGRQLRTAGDGAKPAPAVLQAVRAEIASAYPPGDQRRAGAAMDAALAHYAASGLAVEDPKSDEARAALRRSVDAVTGSTTRNGVQYGGVQSVHGARTVLPPSMTATQAETLLETAGKEAWAKASPSGQVPMWGQKTPVHDVRNRDDLTLLSLGGGQYAIGYRQRGGQTVFMRDPSRADGVFRFDLQALAEAMDDG